MLQLTSEQREEFARLIAGEVADKGTALVMYEPGDMTHYEFVLVQGNAVGGVAFATEDSGPLVRRNFSRRDTAMFDPEHKRACYVPVDMVVHPSFLREHWTDNEWEAIVIAELLTMVNGCDPAPIRASAPHIFPDPEAVARARADADLLAQAQQRANVGDA